MPIIEFLLLSSVVIIIVITKLDRQLLLHGFIISFESKETSTNSQAFHNHED